MNILLISNNFPPEVNALATRSYEHARIWAQNGGNVEVITDNPNYPEGKIYTGYSNVYTYERVDKIKVHRVPMYIAENKGTIKRILSYVSFMVSAVWYSRKLTSKPAVILASSPQIFSALAGLLISRWKKIPFILEIRDLWPESIVAVGAMKRNAIIRFFEKIEMLLYKKAQHIVVVTEAFRQAIIDKGIEPDKISVLKNGVDLKFFSTSPDKEKLKKIELKHGLGGKFVVSYMGTIGMAHKVDILFEAARRSNNDAIVYLVIGTGAEQDTIKRLQEKYALPNFFLIDKQPKELMPYYLSLTDVFIVHLKDVPLFRTVIPSKIFEAMAMKKPLVAGVEGETRTIIEKSGAGIPVRPEDPDEMNKAIEQLYQDKDLYRTMASNGYEYVVNHHVREELAERYWKLLISQRN